MLQRALSLKSLPCPYICIIFIAYMYIFIFGRVSTTIRSITESLMFVGRNQEKSMEMSVVVVVGCVVARQWQVHWAASWYLSGVNPSTTTTPSTRYPLLWRHFHCVPHPTAQFLTHKGKTILTCRRAVNFWHLEFNIIAMNNRAECWHHFQSKLQNKAERPRP